jgi:hypothetical protein
LINGEKIEVYGKELGSFFVIIAYRFTNYPLTIDGVTIYKSYLRKRRQIVFEGSMDILENSNETKECFESFKAIVTDKRNTKQGIQIKIWVGGYFGEGNLLDFYE